jgi:hypothetical protein
MIDVKVNSIRVTALKSFATEATAKKIAEMFDAEWPDGFANKIYVDVTDGYRQAAYKVVVEK